MSTSTALSPEMITMVRAATEAPSVLNTQPWRFRVRDRHVELHADMDRLLLVTDPRARQLTISCGAALCNLTVAARHLGYEPVVQVLPDPDHTTLLAAIDVSRPHSRTRTDDALFDAVELRHTARTPYDGVRLTAETILHLEAEADAEGGLLRFLPSAEVEPFLTLTREADARLRADPAVRREYAVWVGSPRRAGDGVPDRALGMLDVNPNPVIRDLTMGRAWPSRPAGAGELVPNLAVISTFGDERADWLRAGAATQRVLLQITRIGLVASFLTQPVEDPTTLAKLRHPSRVQTFPQVVLRIGHGAPGQLTPRRPIDEVLLG